MNCSEVRELSPVWLSGELGEALRAEVAAHLDGCAGCARSMSEAAQLDSRIRKALSQDDPETAALESRVLGQIHAQVSRRRWLVAGTLAAAVLLAMFLGRLMKVQPQPSKLFADAARDHRLEVMEHQPRRWHSVPGEVAAMAQRFGLTPEKALALAPTGYRLLHAKTCGLEGRPALHLVYSNGAQEISLYVRQEEKPLVRADSASVGDESMASAGRSGYSTVAVTTGNPDECRKIAQLAASLL